MTDKITFLLNGERVTVEGLPPTTTLLQYLRERKRMTGTKEGCAEGDCGACTVAVGSLHGGKTGYKSLNACIALLPTLDGREVITVEHLKSKTGAPNAVQKAMVDCHASQCGFCTPGFVMSLSTLLHNKKQPDGEDVQDAIAGNLCRCTGYRPILDAAHQAAQSEDNAMAVSPDVLKELARGKMFRYETPEGKFFAPVTVEELAGVLAEYPDATMLAGGTDVGLWVTKFHMDLPVIVYTANISALREIKKTDAGLEIGAAASYADAFAALADYDASMETLLRRFASVQIRNAGTVGGNIANGSPIGDGPPPLIVLGARITLRSKSGARELPLEDFFLEYKKQDRQPGEFLEKIFVPEKPQTVLFKTYKLSKRFDQDISAVCAAYALDVQGGKIVAARIAHGGMAGTPQRASETEAFLQGRDWNEETVRGAQALLEKDYRPMTDMRASAQYRMDAAKGLLYRFFLETTAPEAQTQVYGYGG
ncbi:MAG: xanthine dehydrogenase small subunit [Alphaproteobacteria bacterium]|nr:xanthine dehydrogenase small subunit [Alphaproteobacteria bacterium]